MYETDGVPGRIISAGTEAEKPCLSAMTLYKPTRVQTLSTIFTQPSREPFLATRNSFGLDGENGMRLTVFY
jgi:hypothetical protein